MKRNQIIFLGLAVICMSMFLTSCADTEAVSACLTGQQYGFLHGLLHGFITPISFVGSLFKDDVAVYAVNNSGGWYDFGFLLGSSGWGFMAGKSAKKARS